MAALQCEICSGKLVGKPGGLFECEYCGVEYNTDWAKAKIQEIKGTVKVEGTVQVAGTVKVEGQASKENLLQRGRMALEDGQWDTAESCYNKILDMDPQCAEAYFGLAIAKRKYREKEDYVQLVTNPSPRWLPIQEHHEYWQAADLFRRAESLAEGSLREYLESVRKEGEAQLEAQRQAEAKAKAEAEEEQRKKEKEKQTKKENWQKKIAPAQNMISTATRFAIGLKSNGTVMIAGKDAEDYDVSHWRDIVAVSAGEYHIVGLKSDGTVVAAGKNDARCNVSDWTEIVAVSAGDYHTVGLKGNGTVVAGGSNHDGECNVSNWTDIVAISAASSHTVGLRTDGTVLAVGDNEWGQCNVSDWTDIVAVNAGGFHTAGLRSDGTVLVTQREGAKKISGWENVVSIAISNDYLLGLTSSGGVIIEDFYGGKDRNFKTLGVKLWRRSDIVAIVAGGYRVIWLQANGSVEAHYKYGFEDYCVLPNWKLFGEINTIEQERETARKKEKEHAERLAQRRQEHRDRLEAERNALREEMLNLKGLFSGMQRKKIEARLAEIETELKGLS